MDTLVRTLRFINVLSSSLVAGWQLFVLLVVIPVKRKEDRRESVLIHQEMLSLQIDQYLLPTSILSAITGISLLLQNRDRTRASVIFNALALLGLIAVGISAERFDKPINQKIQGWSRDAVPEEYLHLRDRWDRIHAIRTMCGLFMGSCHLAAALMRRTKG